MDVVVDVILQFQPKGEVILAKCHRQKRSIVSHV